MEHKLCSLIVDLTDTVRCEHKNASIALKLSIATNTVCTHNDVSATRDAQGIAEMRYQALPQAHAPECHNTASQQ